MAEPVLFAHIGSLHFTKVWYLIRNTAVCVPLPSMPCRRGVFSCVMWLEPRLCFSVMHLHDTDHFSLRSVYGMAEVSLYLSVHVDVLGGCLAWMTCNWV